MKKWGRNGIENKPVVTVGGYLWPVFFLRVAVLGLFIVLGQEHSASAVSI